MLNMFTPFQKNNLLQFLNRCELKGIDEANALMELVNIIRETPLDQSDKTQPQLKSDTPIQTEHKEGLQD